MERVWVEAEFCYVGQADLTLAVILLSAGLTSMYYQPQLFRKILTLFFLF